MANLPLARALRPKTYADVNGHEPVIAALKQLLVPLKHHTFLFSGPRGLGKTTLSRLIAQTLMCSNKETVEPCGYCDNCQQIQQGQHPDFIEIDGASKTKVEDIRDFIQRSYTRPLVSAYKVYLIDEAHMLSLYSFNALLKALEEPPEHVVYILATTEHHKLPPTVRSRCMTFVLQPPTPQKMLHYLQEYCRSHNIQYQIDIAQAIVQEAQGSYRDLLNILQYCLILGDGALMSSDIIQYLSVVPQEDILLLLQHITTAELKKINDFFQKPALITMEPERLLKQIMRTITSDQKTSVAMKAFIYPQLSDMYQGCLGHPFPWEHIELSLMKIALSLKKKIVAQ